MLTPTPAAALQRAMDLLTAQELLARFEPLDDPASRSDDLDFFLSEEDDLTEATGWYEGDLPIDLLRLRFTAEELTTRAHASDPAFWREEAVREEKIARAVEERGGWRSFLLRSPIVVKLGADGLLELIDGWHRLKLARAAGETHARCVVADCR